MANTSAKKMQGIGGQDKKAAPDRDRNGEMDTGESYGFCPG